MTAPRKRGMPGKPPMDLCRDLAKRMSKVDAEARRELALLNDGHTSTKIDYVMSAVRKHAQLLAYGDSPKVPMDLRRDLKVFLTDYGKPRGESKPAKVRWEHQVPLELHELVKKAADVYGVSVPEFVRGAAAVHAEQVLGQQ